MARIFAGMGFGAFDFQPSVAVPVASAVMAPQIMTPSLGGGAWAYDPGANGFSNAVNRPFNSLSTADADRGTGSFPDKTGGSEGWDGRGVGGEVGLTNGALHTDATAPLSPSNVYRVTYHVGQSAGAGPVNLLMQPLPNTHGGTVAQEWYFRMAFHWDFSNGRDWYNGTNKLCFFNWQGTGAGPFLMAWASGANDTSPLLTMNMQATVDNGKDFGGIAVGVLPSTGEVDQSTLAGVWHRLEIRQKLNSSGTADGECQGWLDGSEIWNVSNIQYLAGTGRWSDAEINPIRGGLNDDVNTEYYLDVDQFDCWIKA